MSVPEKEKKMNGPLYTLNMEEIENLNKTEAQSESVPELKPHIVRTAKGSEYTYLDDGRTQRFKPAAREDEVQQKSPKDVLVFIPPASSLNNSEISDSLPEWFKDSSDEMVVEKMAQDYIFGNGKKFAALINERNEYVTSNEMARESEELFLCFVDAERNVLDFRLPISADPKIGYNTFDAEYEFDDEGRPISLVEPHIGNAVVDIEYEEEIDEK